jgi:hypothetical protein
MRALLSAALSGTLRATLGCPVFEAASVRAPLPHAVVEEPELRPLGAVGLEGREGRVVIAIRDAGERPERLRALVEAAEAAAGTTGPGIGEGWRLVRAAAAKSRVVREREGWLGTVELQVRLYRENG